LITNKTKQAKTPFEFQVKLRHKKHEADLQKGKTEEHIQPENENNQQ
jgi:hypothetical protein